MANGVVVCSCGTIHWNNAHAVKELYALIQVGKVVSPTDYVRFLRQQNRYINPTIARKRFRVLAKMGLIQSVSEYLLSKAGP